MFCGRCGTELSAEARFCSACGAPATAASGWAAGGYSAQTLTRPRGDRMIAGVCAGLAQHYHWDLTWTRVIAVLLAVFSSGAGIVAYIVFWIVMPEASRRLPANASGSVGAPPTAP